MDLTGLILNIFFLCCTHVRSAQLPRIHLSFHVVSLNKIVDVFDGNGIRPVDITNGSALKGRKCIIMIVIQV